MAAGGRADWLFDRPRVRRSPALRSFLAAAWLGWQIESNWADPFLFAVYSIVRPIAGILILVVMYNVVSRGAESAPMFAYMYLGSALYILVGMVITGVSWVVIDDREHYRTSKQLHTAPMDHYAYLYGRGVARLIIGLVSVVITVAFGIMAFDLPVDLSTIDWPLLVVSMVLGIATLAGAGLILGSLTMMMARHYWSVGEAVAGGLYLFTGAIFPLETLPDSVRWFGYCLPITYWLELARRALLGSAHVGFPTLAAVSNAELLVILTVFAALLAVSSSAAYRRALSAAKERGLIDLESSY